MKRILAIFLLIHLISINIYIEPETAYAQSKTTASKTENTKPISPGGIIPQVNLQDAAGKKNNLSEQIKQKPAVIIFYRGGWCPYCNQHLRQLKTIEPKLRKLGFQILAVSPDRPSELSKSIEKQQMTYKLLSDNKMKAARAFGIAFRVADKTLKKYEQYGIDLQSASGQNHHLLPVPSVFIVGTDGVIDFAYSNPDYKIRMTAEEVLQAAEDSAMHPDYNEVLKQFVENGFVNYAGLKNNPGKLNQYLETLSRVPEEEFESWKTNRQLAYLINLYNAAALKLIIKNYPVESIKDTGGFFTGPFDQKFIRLFGNTVALDTIEHEIIRKKYDEPRIHFALVCAAKSCPQLRNEAYTAYRLDSQLNDQAKTFLSSRKGLRIDRSKKKVFLSSIFKWFGEDFLNKYIPESESKFKSFDKTERAVLNFITHYLSSDDKKYLQSADYTIKYLNYNWSLNEIQENK